MSLDDLLLDTSFLFIADELDLSIDTTEVDFFGIKIDSKPVIKMYSEENDATTFTFAIKYEEGEPLKNVLLHCRNGGAVGHILSYHGSSDELLDVFCQTNDDDVFIPVSKEPLNGNMLELRGCIFIVVETCIKCTGGPFHTCEQSCQCPTPNDPCRPPVLTTQTLRVCDGDGGGGGDDNVHFFPHADGSGPNGGGSTGVGPNDPDPNEFGTEIIVPTDLDKLRSIYVVLDNIGLLDEIDAESILTSLPEDCFGEDMLPSSDCVLESVVEAMFPECDLSTAALEAVLNSEESNASGTSWKDLQDLSCDNLECVFGDADLLLAVMNESSKEMINPCSPEKSSGDIINDALAEAQNEDCSLEGFEAALDGVDKIIPDQSFENCDKVKCIYDLLDNQNNGLFCSTFGELFDSEEFTLELFTAPRSSLSWNADGATSFSGNSITITIADDLCDGDAHPIRYSKHYTP